jgi:hypothetical protein
MLKASEAQPSQLSSSFGYFSSMDIPKMVDIPSGPISSFYNLKASIISWSFPPLKLSGSE